MNKTTALVEAVTAYFNKRGIDHAGRKGNEDISAMADALSDWGFEQNVLQQKLERQAALIEDLRIGAEQASQSHYDVLAKIQNFQEEMQALDRMLAR